MNLYYKLVDICNSFLGDSKNDINEYSGQIQYNCPCCSIDTGMYQGDGKYNLEINFKKGVFKCWKCEISGKISHLIKEHGSNELLNEYKSEINNIRLSKLYLLTNPDDQFLDTDFGENVFELPTCSQKISFNNIKHKKAIEYLKGRGINEDIINKYSILCTGFDCDFKMRNRVIIPSYDKYGNLNYWVGRNYDNYKYATKYENPKTDKTKIIFNEKLINWDGNVCLVEGMFDHIVVPNSIPLLGKELKDSYYLYEELMQKANMVTLFFDREAYEDTFKIYKLLNKDRLKNKIFIVNYDIGINDNPFLDPSKIHELYGKKGIIKFLQNTYQIDDIYLMYD